jgi:hypothetical protein
MLACVLQAAKTPSRNGGPFYGPNRGGPTFSNSRSKIKLRRNRVKNTPQGFTLLLGEKIVGGTQDILTQSCLYPARRAAPPLPLPFSMNSWLLCVCRKSALHYPPGLLAFKEPRVHRSSIRPCASVPGIPGLQSSTRSRANTSSSHCRPSFLHYSRSALFLQKQIRSRAPYIP